MVTRMEQMAVWKGMRRYGGGFIEALGEALVRADGVNAGKIKAAFPEEWKKYYEIGKKIILEDAPECHITHMSCDYGGAPDKMNDCTDCPTQIEEWHKEAVRDAERESM